MCKFEQAYITINQNQIPVLKDENNINWYPMKMFFERILFRPADIKSYRDSEFSKYMQVIEFIFNNEFSNKPTKTWFVNEKGLKIILKNINTGQKHKIRARIREQYLYEACLFFNIQRPDVRPKYKKQVTDLSEYDEWTKICLETDFEISEKTVWKRCNSCNKYFPNNKKYFNTKTLKNKQKVLRSTCKKCHNKNFKSTNPDIQKQYNIGGVELINSIKKRHYLKSFQILMEKSSSYVPPLFYDKNTLIQLIKYIKKEIIKNDKSKYNLKYISQFIKISPLKMSQIIGNDLKIGTLKSLEIKRKKRNTISRTRIKSLCKDKFTNTIPSSKINISGIKPIIGIITQNGLHIICDEIKNIRYAKLYKFTNNLKEMEKIIKIIEKADKKNESKSN